MNIPSSLVEFRAVKVSAPPPPTEDRRPRWQVLMLITDGAASGLRLHPPAGAGSHADV